jgi:hypothetical protein
MKFLRIQKNNYRSVNLITNISIIEDKEQLHEYLPYERRNGIEYQNFGIKSDRNFFYLTITLSKGYLPIVIKFNTLTDAEDCLEWLISSFTKMTIIDLFSSKYTKNKKLLFFDSSPDCLNDAKDSVNGRLVYTYHK